MTLHLSPDLELPVDAVTGTFGILATKGAGKSNAAVVMAEEMWDAGVPWVAVDPKGDWYGIRSSEDGKGPGLPIIVFGGRHGDVPLEPTAGALLADLVLDQRITCVLDVSQFTKADVVRFLTSFGERLFRHADDDGAEPLHLFLEEAHEYLPQQVTGPLANMVSTWQRIVKQGRFKGLGCTLISQRSSSLNKDVLELVDTLIVLRTIGPRSRDAIKQWVKDQDVDEGLLASLPTLQSGDAWVWSPGELQLMQRIRFRRRRTFDSGATPKVGQARRAPATLADVDLAVIKDQMAETIEKAKADDPKELRKRIRELEVELAERPTEREVVEVEIPVIPPMVRDAVVNIGQIADRASVNLQEAIAKVFGDILEQTVDVVADGWGRHVPVPAAERTPPRTPERTERALKSVKPQVGAPRRVDTAGDTELTPAHRELLVALAQQPHGWSGQDLAVLVGKRYSGGFRNYLASLRTAGYVEGANKAAMRITDAGLAALGDWEPLPTGRALLEHWLDGDRITPAEKEILRHLDAEPGLTGPDLADRCGKEYSGGFRNYLAKLRTLRLIVGTNGGGMSLSELLEDR